MYVFVLHDEQNCFILAQDVTGYPTLKFFKSGADSSVKHRGGRDIDSLVAFIDEQMGRAPAKKEVRIMRTDNDTNYPLRLVVLRLWLEVVYFM